MQKYRCDLNSSEQYNDGVLNLLNTLKGVRVDEVNRDKVLVLFTAETREAESVIEFLYRKVNLLTCTVVFCE